MSPPDPGDPLLGTPPPILGCLALPVGAKRGWRERGDVPARRGLSRLAVHAHFSLKVSLASLQIRPAVVRIIGGSPRTRYPVSPMRGSKVNDYDLRLPQILTSQRVSPYLQKLLMAPAAAPDPACAVSHRVGTRGGGPRQAPGSSRGSSRHSPAHEMLIPVSNRHLPTLSPKGNLEELLRRLELEAATTPAPPLLLKKLPSWPCPRLQGRVGRALPRGGPAPGFGNPGKSSERRAG